ncbi:hypothetical protein [Saccharopolyspora sp. NPDC049426]|uniref:hypothetical protein n=1 Tax=Saccharopolyspora sp. NPDC049426 TaxID=3155652 RepID=UPI0034396849
MALAMSSSVTRRVANRCRGRFAASSATTATAMGTAHVGCDQDSAPSSTAAIAAISVVAPRSASCEIRELITYQATTSTPAALTATISRAGGEGGGDRSDEAQ